MSKCYVTSLLLEVFEAGVYRVFCVIIFLCYVGDDLLFIVLKTEFGNRLT